MGYDVGINLQKPYEKHNDKAFPLPLLYLQFGDDDEGYGEHNNVNNHAADTNRDCSWCGGGTPGKQRAVPCLTASRYTKT